MKSYKIALFFMFTINNLFAQSQKENDCYNLFDKGIQCFEKGLIDSSIIILKEVYNSENCKSTTSYPIAFFNIPVLYLNKGEVDSAQIWFNSILNSDLKDNDETGSLMEPHANYKHKSAYFLAELEIKKKNWKEVYNWMNKIDTLYRYWGFEGSATNVSLYQSDLLYWKTIALLELKEKKLAEKEILIELICADELEDFFSTSKDTLLYLLKTEKKFKNSFEKGLSEMKIEKKDDNNWVASFFIKKNKLEFKISNKYPDRNLPHYWTIFFIDPNTEPNKEKIITEIKSRQFYKELK
jgi:hypothetical protein